MPPSSAAWIHAGRFARPIASENGNSIGHDHHRPDRAIGMTHRTCLEGPVHADTMAAHAASGAAVHSANTPNSGTHSHRSSSPKVWRRSTIQG
ncbi:hypothetical protein OV079_47840 [Nannocystis pusilla]|uniref:Uncharacterized protein n=1 Tax=Nannocystis pusilla TaxID=889268 RepID=A0A9X3EZ96_9BACT|nr:hypothetical protein [Nannocystis pusilla]MCY1013118.1 hypothetical protein [Nannocystis pusilla]